MHKKNTRNELRIIGGRWRGRRLHFPDVSGLRPTPDRVRETLFNWLQHDIAHSRCLDLFAGSGAIGLEALSRGASKVTFVEQQKVVVKYLRDTLQTLEATNAEVRMEDSRRFIAAPASHPFDIVFLDPPFSENYLPELCAMLETNGWLASSALIYIESPSQSDTPTLPAHWTLLKNQRAGAVSYHLAQRKLDVPTIVPPQT